VTREEETPLPADLTDDAIVDLLGPYGVVPPHALCESVRSYISTLLLWNSKIALTTVTNPVDIVRLHFGESFFAARTASITGGRVADIGTGAGFPGIPIRMVTPGVGLTLVEPIAKKTAFLGEVVRKLGLSGVDIIRCRMEELPPEQTGFDLMTARALGRYLKLARWAESRISKGGELLLMLGEAEVRDLVQLRGWNWREPLRIPQSTARFVLIGSPLV
jgi:16S rRNA (guanine527-N7)-methyltransferase